MILLKLNLSKIPKDKIFNADSGAKYLDVVVFQRDIPTDWGDTLTVSISKTKEEREAGEQTIYIGSERELGQSQGQSQKKISTENSGDGLPF